MAMTQRQMFLAVARGEHLDKLPFGARIDLWYNYNFAHNTLPEKYRGWSETDIIRDLGGCSRRCTPQTAVKEVYRGVEVVEKSDPPCITTEYITPVGTVSKKEVLDTAEGAHVWFGLEKLFKSAKDYPVIKYMMENAVPVEDFQPFYKARDEVGEDGIVMTGTFSPIQRVMRDIIGYELFFYELADHPREVEELIEVAKDLERRKLKIVIECESEIVLVAANWIDVIHTPVFRKYFIPWFHEVTDFLHNRGKLAAAHVDGEMRRLLPMCRETGVDLIEAWTPAPMTSVTTAELRKAWGDQVVIWGGIPAILFEPQYSDEQFDTYIKNLFREIAPGYNFIVGMGDNLPFDADINRVRRVVELIDKYGRLPIEI